ncbi:hypothetical protein [Nocardia spumae]|uniref:hypothetical protein n=1 Tax=Nocardia spumae TaxID=2887190 RepID=UPI001D15AC07|nr:hypothetical protein [Nocardia spumae]
MTTRNTPRKNVGRLAALQAEVKIPGPYVLTPEIVIEPPTRGLLRAARAAAEIEGGTPEDYNKVFFGAQWDAINKLFDAQPEAVYDKFIADISTHFFGPGANDVEGKSQDSSES